ncbi:helix-turn-helix transcriptional regulator [Hymenobacter cavernae]|uniref:Transcriptional regulator n=1 Tax=Hymenobacter cavernae TaxID=2044852 RepID=A0ABQ1UUF9_9BACT|nr:YafY family protein [Hymenobacter cavernae]GGF26831.1 transcriptional regulator [Hymenobacter cavernae]
MNRFDRITAILIQLQAKRMVKGSDLAARYGVSLRTVYRDLRTLEEAGVPLCGEAGVGYSLADGYRLPPVMFSREEATALITAEKLVAQLTDAHTAQVSQTAMDKLRAVLRRPDRDYLEALGPHIRVFRPRSTLAAPLLPGNTHQQLLDSIAARRVVTLDYRAGYHGTATQRDIEPIGVYFGQYWHVVAFCRLRQEYRDFRLDRIAGIRLRDEEFAPRPDTLQSYWEQQAQQWQTHAAVVRFGPAVLPSVQENKHYFGWAHEQAAPDGSLEMTFLVGCLKQLAKWLLLFAPDITIVSPPELRQHVRDLARAAYAHFG